jgi:hypothetical protein
MSPEIALRDKTRATKVIRHNGDLSALSSFAPFVVSTASPRLPTQRPDSLGGLGLSGTRNSRLAARNYTSDTDTLRPFVSNASLSSRASQPSAAATSSAGAATALVSSAAVFVPSLDSTCHTSPATRPISSVENARFGAASALGLGAAFFTGAFGSAGTGALSSLLAVLAALAELADLGLAVLVGAGFAFGADASVFFFATGGVLHKSRPVRPSLPCRTWLTGKLRQVQSIKPPATPAQPAAHTDIYRDGIDSTDGSLRLAQGATALLNMTPAPLPPDS